tara:strand:+ start:1270 stop:1626 length:357 start_codon:yes stop_codon:yes gene_type:complete
MSITKNDKIVFIKDSINNNLIDHKIIINYTNMNNIDISRNMNGIFLTINKLSDKDIDNIMNLINKYIKEKNYINTEIKNYNNIIENTKNSSIHVKEKKEYLDIKFNKLETELIESSLN